MDFTSTPLYVLMLWCLGIETIALPKMEARHHQGDEILMMEAASTSETSVNFYQTTRRNNPEDSHLHTSHSENPKSQ
jgi:hypothetical protein